MTHFFTKKDYLKYLPDELQLIFRQFDLQSFDYLPHTIITSALEQTAMTQSELGLALLPLASGFAIAPVSNFQVGAVAFDSEGNAYLGANFEFCDAHIGQTIHAEQSAIANAWQHGAKDLSLLVINYPPCGHCRQFINEVKLAPTFQIQLPNCQAKSLADYLPEAFGPEDLEMTDRILGDDISLINGSQAVDNDCMAMATLAHDKSHAPYSLSKSGIALQYEDDEIVTGCYAENAAFNPSLPALQVALNQRRLQGKDWKAIKKAVMVETTTTLSQFNNAKHLLKNSCDIELVFFAR